MTTFHGKNIKLPSLEERQWLNLETGRRIKNSQGHLFFLPDPPVAGSLKSINEFLLENGLKYDTGKLIAGLLPASPLQEKKAPVSPPPTVMTACVGGVTFGFSTCELDKTISRVKDTKVTKQIKTVTSLFVDLKVAQEAPKKLPPLLPPQRTLADIFKGLRVTGKCIYIADGDTIDVELTVPLSHFTPGARGTFPLRMRTRLLEYDAAEKETQHGLIAALFLGNRLQQDGFFISLRIESLDLHGRGLAHGYTLSGERYSEYMLKIDTPIGKVCLSYDGGTKSSYFTSMKERTPQEAEYVKKNYGYLLNDQLREIMNSEIVSWL